MLHKKAVKKVEKALGVKVELIGNCRYGCTYDGFVLSWLVQRKWRTEGTKILKDGPLEASNWHIRHEDDHSDSMVDYFAGSYRDNVTQLIQTVKPSPPKFPIGSLVQGKENKRAKRHGYARRLAIVTEASGGYMYLSWTSGKKDSYRKCYPERDFQLVG